MSTSEYFPLSGSGERLEKNLSTALWKKKLWGSCLSRLLCSTERIVFTSFFTLLAEPFLTVHMLCTEKRLCTNPVKFLLSMLSALLSNSFEPRPNRYSFLTVSFRRTFRRHFYLLPAGSVLIIGFSQKLMLALEKPSIEQPTVLAPTKLKPAIPSCCDH